MQVQFEKHSFRLLQENAATLVPVPHVNQIIHKQRQKQCGAQEHAHMRLQTLQFLLAVLILCLGQLPNGKPQRPHSDTMMSQ
jgi:hypothetical protein